MNDHDETTEAIRLSIHDAIEAAEKGRDGAMFDQSFAAYQAAQEAMRGDEALPTLVEGSIVEDMLHGHQLLVDVLGAHDDIEKARLYRFRVLWRTTRWRSSGMDVAGSCAPVKDRERDLYGLQEHYEVTLNLAWWLSLDEPGRQRLMHHELMHVARDSKAHPVEEWPSTVARFGLGNRAQALLVAEALNRHDIRESLEALLRDEDPQIPGWLP